MKFPLTEPTNSRYLFINPKTNQVHVLMPIVSGTQIGLDNTCKSVSALQEFFGKSRAAHQRAVLDELTAYKKMLEFDISLLDDNAIKTQKEERLSQINQYIRAVEAVLNSTVLNPLNLSFPEYPRALQEIMKKETANLHSMVLSPKVKDSFLRFVNPVFSVKRDGTGALYDRLSKAYQRIESLPNAKTRLIASVLATPAGRSNDFEGLQDVLTVVTKNQLGVAVDFNHLDDKDKTPVTQSLIDAMLGSDEANPSVATDYIEMLLSTSAPELFNTLVESPFYTRNNAEELSIITQFFLANVNIYCNSNKISTINFGEILDKTEALSEEIAAIVLSITNGASIEDVLLDFMNRNSQDFGLERELTLRDRAQIKQKFTEHFSEIKKSPHFDEFILLDGSKKGLFISHQGSICLNFAEFIQAALPTLELDYFKNICTDFNTLKKEDITPTNPSVHAMLELSVDELLAKIKDEDQLEAVLKKLPQAQQDEMMASPKIKRMQVPKFLLHVARGEQDEAEKLLKANPEAAFLLQVEGFTDYSGRSFYCTAFEYAYWAKDTHMCRMLIQHMNDATKIEMHKRCEAIENVGLTYRQKGEIKNSTHFDLKPTETTKITLITALKNYVDGYDNWYKNNDWDAMKAAWMEVGKSQRDVPAHVAHEYCHTKRSFDPKPTFNDETLPRSLTFHNWVTGEAERWFPLAAVSTSSGLGVDFALYRGRGGAPSGTAAGRGGLGRRRVGLDLAAVSHREAPILTNCVKI